MLGLLDGVVDTVEKRVQSDGVMVQHNYLLPPLYPEQVMQVMQEPQDTLDLNMQ